MTIISSHKNIKIILVYEMHVPFDNNWLHVCLNVIFLNMHLHQLKEFSYIKWIYMSYKQTHVTISGVRNNKVTPLFYV